ncbi:hypothetical protein MMC06_002752 [Schaereria dolodes]|nr:hypothetical protein [Schaereria dolodes]
MSSITRRTVATAVAGDLAKFLFEELISDGHFDVVIISQAVREWIKEHGANVQITYHTTLSIQAIPDTARASVLFPFLHDNTAFYNDAHEAMDKFYMEPLPGVWPIDLEKWESMTLGSGDYSVGWTSARDVSKASTKLVDAEKWPPGRPLINSQKSVESIEQALVVHANDDDPALLWTAFMDEWNITGASAPLRSEILRQRNKYFSNVKFRNSGKLLQIAGTTDRVRRPR